MFENYAEYEYPLAAAQLVFAMFGMGALLAPRDFILEIKHPKPLSLGLAIQFIMVPLIALAFCTVLPIHQGVAVGILVISTVPGGTMSNILSLFGRANIALSISITAITTVAALVTTPLLLQILIMKYLPDNFSMPTAQIAFDIGVTLILPLIAGMLVHRFYYHYSELISRWSIRISLTIIVIIVIGAAQSGRLDPMNYGLISVVWLVVFAVVLMLISYLISTSARIKIQDRVAITIEVGMRNTSLAIAIKAIIFPAQAGQLDPVGDAVFFAALLYGGIGIITSVIAVLISRRIIPAPSQAKPATAGK